MSAADKARHYRLGHCGKRGIERKETTKDKATRLTYDICSRGDRESDFLGFREASGLDTISRHFPAGIGKFVNI